MRFLYKNLTRKGVINKLFVYFSILVPFESFVNMSVSMLSVSTYFEFILFFNMLFLLK